MTGRQRPDEHRHQRAWPGRLAPLLAFVAAGCNAPMSYLEGDGPVASDLARLGWWLIIVSCVVIVVVTLLVMVGGATNRRRELRRDDIGRTGGGLPWIFVGGIIVPAIVLVLTMAFNLAALHATTEPRRAAATVRVIGHRWWWELQYEDGTPSHTVTTANELHLPLGEPVKLELVSADVIHSFWIPKLAGKTDVIPGQTNIAWIEADRPGIYRGQCTEYCGTQHANMGIVAVAESPTAFQAWLRDQRDSAATPGDPAAAAGRDVFVKQNCAACHAIRGTDALGTVGPDLTHLASRLTLAAGTLPNTRGNLAGWIGNTQAIKPGNDMPTMHLAPNDLQALLAYLETLK